MYNLKSLLHTVKLHFVQKLCADFRGPFSNKLTDSLVFILKKTNLIDVPWAELPSLTNQWVVTIFLRNVCASPLPTLGWIFYPFVALEKTNKLWSAHGHTRLRPTLTPFDDVTSERIRKNKNETRVAWWENLSRNRQESVFSRYYLLNSRAKSKYVEGQQHEITWWVCFSKNAYIARCMDFWCESRKKSQSWRLI